MPWEPLPDKVGEPKPLDASLDALMSKLAGASLSSTEVIFDRWPEVIGSGLAQFTKPSRIDAGCLYISVDDAAFGNEVRWMEQTIIERVVALAGSCPVDRVRAVVG